MPNLIFFGVIVGAFLHASWNAVVKAGAHKMLQVALVCSSAGLIGALALPFFRAPAPGCWPYLLASTLLQYAYYALLAAAYRTGDMGAVYPLMRGTAPVLVAVCGSVLLNEALSPFGWVAAGAICLGILSLAVGTPHRTVEHRAAVWIALLNAVVIASYTLLDGIGVRKSGSPVAYTMWIFVLTAVPILGWALARHRGSFVSYARNGAVAGLYGGAATVGSYLLALIAMTQAPIALVAALRETSILFALVIATVFLRERLSLRRCIACTLIACGAIAVRLV